VTLLLFFSLCSIIWGEGRGRKEGRERREERGGGEERREEERREERIGRGREDREREEGGMTTKNTKKIAAVSLLIVKNKERIGNKRE
jgi:hypothetical protein